MQLGGQKVWKLALKLLRSMGCIVERNKLSRVDACADMPEMPIAALCEAYSAGHHVTRARIRTSHEREDQLVESNSAVHSFGRRPTGFVVGHDGLKLRAYDKFHESHRVLEKIHALVSYRWGYFATVASRIEFSLGREALKRFGIDTVADWFKRRADVCEHLCTKWFRLTNGPVNRNHADRAGTLPDWLAVQKAFAEWTGTPSYVELTPLSKEPFFPYDLIQQAKGLLVSFFARTGNKIDSNEAFVEEAMNVLLDFTTLNDMAAEVWRRVVELGLAPIDLRELDNDL
jgi:hypothetical protein